MLGNSMEISRTPELAALFKWPLQTPVSTSLDEPMEAESLKISDAEGQ